MSIQNAVDQAKAWISENHGPEYLDQYESDDIYDVARGLREYLAECYADQYIDEYRVATGAAPGEDIELDELYERLDAALKAPTY